MRGLLLPATVLFIAMLASFVAEYWPLLLALAGIAALGGIAMPRFFVVVAGRGNGKALTAEERTTRYVAERPRARDARAAKVIGNNAPGIPEELRCSLGTFRQVGILYSNPSTSGESPGGPTTLGTTVRGIENIGFQGRRAPAVPLPYWK